MAEKTEPSTQTTDPAASQQEFFGGGDTGKAPPPQPELDELEIGGKKFKLEKSAAEAFRAQQDLTRTELERRDQEIRSLRQPAPQPKQEEEFYTPSLDAKFFERPHEYLKQVEERAYQRAEKTLTERYQAANSEQQFWNDFYSENSALDRAKDHWVTKAVLAERQAELAPLSVPEAKKRLSQYTTERLLDIHKRYAPKADPTAATMTLEGSSPPTRRAVAKPEAEEPTRISDWIRERKNMRREREVARSTRKEAS